MWDNSEPRKRVVSASDSLDEPTAASRGQNGWTELTRVCTQIRNDGGTKRADMAARGVRGIDPKRGSNCFCFVLFVLCCVRRRRWIEWTD